MPTDSISFKDTNYFSKLFCDYWDHKDSLQNYFNRFPNLDNFKDQILEKSENYPNAHREVLTEALRNQYKNVEISKATKQHIELLEDANTFTVVTGHQLNLFTGPIYFLYKIISTINLCKTLKQTYPEYNFVPIYWMASEDHDFDEINFFNFKGKKLQWNRDKEGAVGEMDLDGLDLVFEVFSAQLETNENSKELKSLFESAYLNHSDLTEATRFLVNKLFHSYSLVIIDGDDPKLKQLFRPYVKQEILENLSFSKVSETNKDLSKLDADYKIQVNPREINLFYMKPGLRERIIERNGEFVVNNTELVFSNESILTEIEEYPERFSPNVILRPLYQEVILPNLCYIGGAGELSYWLQLKSNFEANEVSFPMLLIRNSVLLAEEKQLAKINRLDLKVSDLFLDQEVLKTKLTHKISEITIDFSDQKQHLREQFKSLHELSKKTDRSFEGAVAAQEQKQIKGLEKLEKRLLKAQKRKLSDHLQRAVDLQNELFPNQSLQERYLNFSEIYLELGKKMIPMLVDTLDPLSGEFSIVSI